MYKRQVLILSLATLSFVVGTGESYTFMMGHFPAPWGNEIRIGELEALMAVFFSLIMMLSVFGGMAHIDREVQDSKKNLFYILPVSYTHLDVYKRQEHGGGNNSTFTTHVVTSSGSDTYSVMAAALASLKGPKHGGANIKVMEMMDDLRANVSDTKDEEKIRNYLDQLVDKQAFDKKGLIYGMGHAVYSLSDPRAVVFKSFVESLAKEKGRMDDYHLYTTIERLAPEVIAEKRKIYKGVSANAVSYTHLYDV